MVLASCQQVLTPRESERVCRRSSTPFMSSTTTVRQVRDGYSRIRMPGPMTHDAPFPRLCARNDDEWVAFL